MNRPTARKIAETASNKDIKNMFLNVKKNFKNWNDVSRVNKGMTKGAVWNILTKGFSEDFNHILAKTNMIHEFGDFLDPDLIPKKDEKKEKIEAVHQLPNLDNIEE